MLAGQANPLGITAGCQPWEMLDISELRVQDAKYIVYCLVPGISLEMQITLKIHKNPAYSCKDGISVEIG